MQVSAPSTLETWRSLAAAEAVLTRALTAALSRHGLTVHAFEVLAALAGAPEHALTRTSLARHTGLTASGITRLLDGLERAGLVTRRSCTSDGRAVYAVLGDAGQARLDAASACYERALANELGERYDPAELLQLSALLDRVAA